MHSRLALAAFIGGTAWAHRCEQLPSARTLLLMGVLGGLALSAWAGLHRRWRAACLLLMLATGLAGFAQSAWRAQLRLDDRLACCQRDQVTRLTLRIAGLASGDALARRFDVDVLAHDAYDLSAQGASGEPMGIPKRVRVSWRAPFGSTRALPEVIPGQVWRMALRLRAPRAARNPHGPDIEGKLFAQGVRAMATVQGTPVLRADDPWASASTLLSRARHALRAAARTVLGDRPYAGVLIALALGDQSGMARMDWVMFGRAGIAHLVAISGLHVGLVAGLAAGLAGQLYRRLRFRRWAAAQVLPAQTVMAVVAWLAAVGYCSLAGWGIPAQRVFVMLSAVVLAVIGRVPVTASGTLMAAAAVIVALDPWAPLAIGFWLSFAAVGTLMLAAQAVGHGVPTATDQDAGRDGGNCRAPHDDTLMQYLRRLRRSGPRWLARFWQPAHDPASLAASSFDDLLQAEEPPVRRRDLLRELAVAGWRRMQRGSMAAARLQWMLTLALAPLLAVTVGQVSLVSPIVNAFAIPIVGLLVTPLALVCVGLAGLGAAGLPGASMLAGALGAMAHGLLAPTLEAARWWSALSWAVWPVAKAPIAVALVAFVAVGWGLMPPGAPGRRVVWLGIAPLLFWRPALMPAGSWDLVALDVGQAAAAVILTRHHTIVFDAGQRFDSGDDSGSRVVVPFLQAIGRSRVDRLIVSHAHLDHAGGVRGLISGMAVGQAFASFDVNRHLRGEADARHDGMEAPGWPLTVSPCAAGQQWTMDGVTLRFVHPAAGSRFGPGQANAASCVLVVEGAHHAAVLPGDIGAAQERAVAEHVGHVDVALAAHHGSATSSSVPWIQTLDPRHVVTQSAYRSRFGHPAPAVQTRWLAQGAQLWRNDLDGAIWFSSREQELAVSASRDRDLRYWHERLSPQGDDPCDHLPSGWGTAGG